MDIRIIVDTSVWIDFFNHPQSPLTIHLQTLLRNRRVILVGMVLAEILQGIKNPKEARLVQQSLGKLPYLEMTLEDWQQAGELSATLRRKGLSLPLSDLVIGTLAIKEGVEIFSIDSHFKKIPGLKVHQPPKSG